MLPAGLLARICSTRGLALGVGVENHRRGDIAVVMPRLQEAAVDVVFTHARAGGLGRGYRATCDGGDGGACGDQEVGLLPGGRA